MPLTLLQITNFRNLDHVELNLSAGCNLFYGDNGAGKTSILEAIYILALGRSFRTATLDAVISSQQDSCVLFAKKHDSHKLTTIGMRRYLAGVSEIHINGEAKKSRAELASLMPVQLIDVHGYLMLEGGPKFRRQFLDWGVFHVEPKFLPAWQAARKALQHRNALLKRGEGELLAVWGNALEQASIEIHAFRVRYLEYFIPSFSKLLRSLLGMELVFRVEYQPGWRTERSLAEQLRQRAAIDMRLGYTGVGPHRADIKFYIDGVKAADRLSRGQQKLFVCALQLAQGQVLRELVKRNCLYLIDDLPSELDQQKRQQVAELLMRMNAQTLITGVCRNDLDGAMFEGRSLFHVERGKVVGVKSGVGRP